MKRTQRIITITKLLSDNPNKIFPLTYFSTLLGSAKSSISEDLKIISSSFSESNLGFIKTSYGSGGGVKYIPHIDKKEALDKLQKTCELLKDNSRILGNGFVYTSDIMFDPRIIDSSAHIFASLFNEHDADLVVTLETKGIPVALLTARLLSLPLVVIRRESKISEGSTLSINYFSGTNQQAQKMSLSKRAVTAGTKAIVIDDFMRAGGSIRGIHEILEEFNVKVVATGVVIASTSPEKKKVNDFIPLTYLKNVDADNKITEIEPNLKCLESL